MWPSKIYFDLCWCVVQGGKAASAPLERGTGLGAAKQPSDGEAVGPTGLWLNTVQATGPDTRSSQSAGEKGSLCRSTLGRKIVW